jgi:tetratricopeptide (TPR) repeat protein
MKKILVLAAAVLMTAGVATAQKNKVTTAYMSLQSYNREKDPADLAKAKAAIDEASVHADTKDEAKTWFYRGNVYLALYRADFTGQLNAIKDVTDAGKKRSMAYIATPATNLNEATNAYLKAKTLDQAKVYSDGVSAGLADCYAENQNMGISFYNQEKYADAMPFFEQAAAISASNGVTDTVMLNNAALSAMNAKLYSKAVPHFQKLTAVGYGKANTWKLLGESYLGMGDSTNYKLTVATGLKKYPTDAGLLTDDVNIKLKEGKKAEAVAQLESLTTQKPNDPEMYFLVGNVYDQMANPISADGKLMEKPANYEELHGKAAENYKKAVELKPDYFDAIYNLGILYYNQSIEYFNRSNSTIADAAKYSSMWEPPLKVAVEYLEKARTMQPKDMNTLLALKVCYGNLGDTDNYNLMKEEIKKAQGQ